MRGLSLIWINSNEHRLNKADFSFIAPLLCADKKSHTLYKRSWAQSA